MLEHLRAEHQVEGCVLDTKLRIEAYVALGPRISETGVILAQRQVTPAAGLELLLLQMSPQAEEMDLFAAQVIKG